MTLAHFPSTPFWCLVAIGLSAEIICVLESEAILHGGEQLDRSMCAYLHGRVELLLSSQANFLMLKSAHISQAHLLSLLVESSCAARDRSPWLALISSKRAPLFSLYCARLRVWQCELAVGCGGVHLTRVSHRKQWITFALPLSSLSCLKRMAKAVCSVGSNL